MKSLFTLLTFVIASHCLGGRITPDDGSNFNVLTYGAIGDGNTDDSDVYIILTYYFIFHDIMMVIHCIYFMYSAVFYINTFLKSNTNLNYFAPYKGFYESMERCMWYNSGHTDTYNT